MCIGCGDLICELITTYKLSFPLACPSDGKTVNWQYMGKAQPTVEADNEYVPFGPEWEKEMMRWSKKELVAELRRRLT